ncbi:MAG TPA: hypothetical protein VFV31_13045 [Chitinophagaceae bacterium]|nr:hypothetical protein [Chitinophagaceae bacterium]
MKSDQFTLFFSPSLLTSWDSFEQPSVEVDYVWEGLEHYHVTYICFTPEILAKLKPLAQFDILQEVNECVYQRVVDYYTVQNETFLETLERIGVRRAEQ